MKYVRRFVFVHFDDLLDIRFKQLEKVTDKLYVFIPKSVEQVPIGLVRQVQKMGPDLDWIELDDMSRSAAVSILSFHVGVLHEKIDLGVEFAILSDNEALDELVSHIDATGRTCVRVKQRGRTQAPATTVDELDHEEDLDAEAEQLVSQHLGAALQQQAVAPRAKPSNTQATDFTSLLDDEYQDLNDANPSGASMRSTATDLPEGFGDYKAFVRANGGSHTQVKPAAAKENGRGLRQPLERPESITEEKPFDPAPLADDLVRRLIRSGNRPADLSMLRSYILLHTDDAEAARNVDGIIQQMVANGEVRVTDDSVAYSF